MPLDNNLNFFMKEKDQLELDQIFEISHTDM